MFKKRHFTLTNLTMSPAFRVLVLLCLAAIIMNMFHSFFNNLYTVKSYEAGRKLALSVSSEKYESTEYVENTTGSVVRNNLQSTTQNASNVDVDSSFEDRIYSKVDLNMLARKHPEIRKGGWYVPSNFTKLHKVAIIVPYRDRKKHLSIFLYYMHMFLMKQQMEYGIFIIEQAGTRPFNRGMLMNVGFLESQKMGTWECFIFHDVDLLPLDQRNLYQCAKQPRHLSASIDSMAYKLPYGHIFGGATAMTLEQFTKANGFSNRYWGWGGEDDDMYRRRPILENATKVFKEEGLSTLHYEVIELTWHQLYTHIIAKLDEKTTVDIRSNVANMSVGGKM